ncbi:MAG: ABC transporter ATP-binding protein [Candidatus Yanofskybacteria bacterium]|nr:ABC transporter ATP-binding protein [Candidatus Yanofskybacteria bacterium]
MSGNLVLVRTESQYQLTSTFLRFQEHYESPKFRGEIFSLEEFMDWYTAENEGEFTYYEDWAGFNIPSSILQPFREGKFDPLSIKERRLLELLADMPEPFYLIGTYGSRIDLPTVKHELVHGLYYTVPDYREEVLRKLEKNQTESIAQALKKAGYHPSVWLDEANAYLMMGIEDLFEDGFRWSDELKNLQKDLQQIFRIHFGFSLRGASQDKILSFFSSVRL